MHLPIFLCQDWVLRTCDFGGLGPLALLGPDSESDADTSSSTSCSLSDSDS